MNEDRLGQSLRRFLRVPWNDPVCLAIWKLTTPCSAVVVALILWLGFWVSTLQRLHDPRLLARMDFAASIITLHDAGQPGTTEDQIVALLKDYKTNKNFEFSQPDRYPSFIKVPLGSTGSPKGDFFKAATALVNSNFSERSVQDNLDLLDKSASTLSDGTVVDRPGIRARFLLSYYTVDGVHFRVPDDSAKLPDLAEKYLEYHGSLHGIYVLTPWELLLFYDPKRVLLDNLLPVAVFVLMVSCRFLFSYRYYDITTKRTKRGKLFLLRKPQPWVPLWQRSIVAGRARVRYHLFWPGAVLVGTLAALAIELKTNDPEVWSERVINIPLMLIAGPLTVILLLLLSSLLSSSISDEFRARSLAFRGRVLLPLLITLGPGVLSLAGWMALFSWDKLIPGPTTDMKLRGVCQIILSVIFAVISVVIILRLLRQSPGKGAMKETGDEDLNPSDSSCLAGVGIRTDEKLIISAALTLAPWLVGIKELFFP
jgi:hypothetical protein